MVTPTSAPRDGPMRSVAICCCGDRQGGQRSSAILEAGYDPVPGCAECREAGPAEHPPEGLSLFTRSRCGRTQTLPGRANRLLTAGRLVPLKGFGLAVKAFGVFLDRLKREGQGSQAELRIIGDGPERSRLQELIKELQLEEQVHLVNWMPREELLGEMAQCDVSVFPSLRDGGGLVVVESMAAGKPVVCLDEEAPIHTLAVSSPPRPEERGTARTNDSKPSLPSSTSRSGQGCGSLAQASVNPAEFARPTAAKVRDSSRSLQRPDGGRLFSFDWGPITRKNQFALSPSKMLTPLVTIDG